jgi:CRISPR-associated endonuclease/helicase Cas3
LPETKIDLSYMDFGEGPKGANWLTRMLALRDDPSLGPLRVAYLEALLRAADWTASRKAEVQDA